jgi:hypothetical protein
MIRAYPGRPSVLPGGTLTLHVSTDSSRFRVAFYRWGDGPVAMLRSDWLPGAWAPDATPDMDWHWPAYRFTIPPDWPSAVYIADLEEDGHKTTFELARDHGSALFVVRPRCSLTNAGGTLHRDPDAGDGSDGGSTRRGMLYKLPLATYHAYNFSGGGCFYAHPPPSAAPPGARVSLRRPGGGTGGPVWCAPDHYDAASPRQTFAHWDARFLRWLVRNGYEADVCTDLDLHAEPALPGRYRLLVSAGHDEYWSAPTRDAVEDFVSSGGNLAFFAANVCWWRIHVVDGGTAIVCHQGGPHGALDQWWSPRGAARPEDSLTGASYRHGGGWWDGPRATDGYRVLQPDHWIFAGTGLARGDALGRHSWPPLAGYECDGVPLDVFDADGFADGKAGDVARGSTGGADAERAGTAAGIGAGAGAGTMLSAWADEDGTPDGYTLLAAARLGPDWQELPARARHATGEGIHTAAMGLFRRNGTVFSAGTTDWAQVLDAGRDRQLERITRNVLDGLLRN